MGLIATQNFPVKPRLDDSIGRLRPVHPHQWLWEPLQEEPSFVLRPMFGGKSAYLDGKLVLYFAAKAEPWRGVLVCTDRSHHDSLRATFPSLTPHPILQKWLYLSEAAEDFERTARQLVDLARQRDARVGVTPQGGRTRSAAKRARRKSHDHP